MRRRIILIVSVLTVVALMIAGIWLYRVRSRGTLLDRAELALQAGELERALDLASSYVASHPQDWRGHLCQGQAYSRLNRFDDARKSLQQAANLKPTEVSIATAVADTYRLAAVQLVKDTNGPPPRDKLKDAIKLFGQSNECLAKIQTGDKKLALDVQQCLGLNLRQIGVAATRLGTGLEDEARSKAGAAAKDAESVRKASLDAYAQADAALAEATKVLLEVMTEDPTRESAACNVLELCQDRGDGASLAAARRVIQANPDSCPVAAALAVRDELRASQEPVSSPAYRQRVGELDDLLKRYPKVTDIRLARAEIALVLGDKGRAATTQPGSAEDIARELGLARELCDGLLQADPANLLAGLFRAKVSILRGDLPDAESRLSDLRTRFPWVPDVQQAFAEVAMKTGHTQLAEDALRLIMTFAPDRPRDFGGRRIGRGGGNAVVEAAARRHMIELLRGKKAYNQAFLDAQAYYKAAPADREAVRLFVELAKATNNGEAVREALDDTRTRYDKSPEILLNAAVGYFLLGDNAEAAKVFQLTAKSSPTAWDEKITVAEAMMQVGRRAESESLLEEALAQLSAMNLGQSPSSAHVRYDLYMLCRKSGRMGQALEHIKAAVRTVGGNISYRLALAQTEFDTGWLDECLSDCQEILRQDPSHLEAAVLSSQVRMSQGQTVDVDQTLAQTAPRTGLSLAYSFLALGRPGKCVELCLEELKKTPDELNGRWLLGQAYLALGQRDECVKQWAQLLKSVPEQWAVYQQIASVLIQDKKPDQVAEAMLALPGVRVEWVDLAMGSIRDRLGEYGAAADAYKRVLGCRDLAEDMRPQVARLRAQSLARMGKLDDAVAELDGQTSNPAWAKEMLLAKAQLLLIGKKPDQANPILADLAATAVAEQDVNVLSAITQLHVQARQIDKALASSDQMMQAAPGDARGCWAKADILAHSGKLAESVDYYQKAIDRQPRNWTLYRDIANALNADQEPLRALEVYKKLEGLGPQGQTEALSQRGALFARWGLFAQATECLEQLAKAGYADNPRLQLALGQAFSQLGQKSKARPILEKIPEHAREYLTAGQLLAELADTLDEKLAILGRLEQSSPGNPNVLSHRIGLLVSASRPDDAVKAFTDFAEKHAKDRPVARGLFGPAFRAMLAAGNRTAAADLAARADKETGAGQWGATAVLLMMDDRPLVAAGLMPDIAKTGFYYALLGLVLAKQAGEPLAKWTDRLSEIVRLADKTNPPTVLDPGYLVLVDLVTGSTARAKDRLTKLGGGGSGLGGQEVLREQIAASEGNPAAAAEAVALLKASLAGTLGVGEVGREWAMSVLKARPVCQWAAAIILANSPDAAMQRKVLEILQPADCTRARFVRASLLSEEGKHVQAADLYGQIAASQPDNTVFLMKQAEALDRAGRFAAALAVYRELWKAKSDPAAANNAACMLALLTPQDVKQSPEVGAWLEAAGKAAPDNPSFRDTRGWILHLQGKTEAAIKDLRFAANGRADSAEVHYHLAVVESASGNTEFARWHLMAAVAIGDRLKAGDSPLAPGVAQAVDQARQMLAKMGPATP